MPLKASIHGSWSSRWAFILAATGSAVGLGNIWKFPYITGENGGGAFVIVYLICIALIGIPIMMAEIMLGRRGRQSPVNTMQTLAIESGHHPAWKYLGIMGVLAGFLILSYYSVIAGWALEYLTKAASGDFNGQTPDGINNLFANFIDDPKHLLLWHTIFMVMTFLVVARGVRGGLELAVKLLMPALLVILIILVGYSMNTTGFGAAVVYLFNPDFSALSWGAVLTAMGHAFFTLSLGMGAIMVYGSYLPRDASIAKTTFIIAFADTAVALLAGLAIFPLVISNNLEAASGPGLIFVTLPLAFGQMPYGTLFGALFFLLLAFAAWTSAISLLEPAVTWLVENRNIKRVTATIIAGIATWLVGILTVFSFQKDSPIIFTFNFVGDKKENGVFDVLDILTANIMLPIGGILIAVFAGWIMSREASRDELEMGEGNAYKTWRVLTRYIAPALVSIVILQLLGLLDPIFTLFAPVIDLFSSSE
ncbi:Sodium-dependent transporter, SNF family [hydrothermal vent metagenome]|uniref:Sodium-dependent transporter, SNF family n=1 Tax=hydrothermal vent metagenome TaxID=652676 RepID=A0A3B0ZBP9_9ZZZZ